MTVSVEVTDDVALLMFGPPGIMLIVELDDSEAVEAVEFLNGVVDVHVTADRFVETDRFCPVPE